MQQGLVLVLPVDVDEKAAHAFQHRQWHRNAVETAAALARRRQGPFQKEAFLFVDILLPKQGRYPRVPLRVEHGLDAEFIRAGTDK